MKTNSVEAFLYVQSASKDEATGMREIISQLKGIIKVRANQYVHSMMNIEYDPQIISGGSIVNAINNGKVNQKGFRVALVGL